MDYISPPHHCDVCSKPITVEYSDARVQLGVREYWANLCPSCAKERGARYGTGKGQRYQKQFDGRFIKVEG